MLIGLGLGLHIALSSLAIGLVIGLFAAFATVSRRLWLRTLVRVYVAFLRNQPPLLLIFFVFFVLPRIGIRFGREESVIAALGLYAGAQITEVFRAALTNIPKGISEAGLAIGLTPSRTNVFVILPVMFRNAVPALGNTFISIFKDTSLAAGIAVTELTWQSRKISTDSFAVLESWIAACLLYVAACLLIAQFLLFIERHLRIP
ncbi:MAG: amino acid ABC transporter permease [Rhodobacteraceae bacterium]|nr:amino acid ABC transporter permease [Paracoccaceae bacterium]MCY4197441.1 amino acid ABC transporter permease [Paracoccaceae bacterium]